MGSDGHDGDGRKQGVAAVFDRAAETYDQIGVDFFTPMGRDLVARAGVSPGDRVLDVGCGRGAVLFAAAEAVGERGRVVGIDLAPRMAELTGAELQARGITNASTATGDAEDPQFADGSFDAILGGLILFFLPDPAYALARYRALLAPGGRLGFTTFGRQDPNFGAAMRALGPYIPGGVPPRGERQGQFGSPEGITELLTANGFTTPVIADVEYESRFADAEHWLAWAWSHGGRQMLEQVPEADLPAAANAAKEALAPAQSPSGDYVIRTVVRISVTTPER